VVRPYCKGKILYSELQNQASLFYTTLGNLQRLCSGDVFGQKTIFFSRGDLQVYSRWVKIGVPGLNSLTDPIVTFEFSSVTPIAGRTSVPSSSLAYQLGCGDLT